MSAQQDNITKHDQAFYDQSDAPSLSTGYWITIIAGCLFIVSLFLDWASAGGFLLSRGIGLMRPSISHASGLPILFSITLLAAIGCSFLSMPFLRKRAVGKAVPTIRVVLAILGLIPFALFPFELKTWLPSGQMEFGGWLAVFAALGLLVGALLTFSED